MKRIAKVAQSAAPIQAVRPLTRPAILHTPRPLAGPSTPPSLPTSSRSLINRAYATTVPGSPASIATELEQEQDDREADEVADLAVSIGGQGRRPLEIPESLEIPPNVRFEGFENVEEPINRGFRIHSNPDSPLSPISHPLSSLSSSNPTSPISSLPPVSLPAHIFAQPLRRDILHRCVVWYLSLLRSGNQSTKSRSTVNYSGRKLRQQKGTGKARVGDASSGIRRGGAPIFALHPRDHAQLLPRKVRALGLATALSSKLSAGLLRIVADLNEAEWSGTAEARRALRDGVAYPGSSTTGFLDEPSTSDTDASALEVESAQVATDTDAALLSELSPEPESGFITRFGNAKDLSILFIYPAPASLADIERLEQFKRSVRNLEGVEVLAMDEVEVYHVLKYKWCVLEKGVVDAISEVQEEGAEFDLQGMGEAVQDIQEGMEGLMSENQGQEHSRV